MSEAMTGARRVKASELSRGDCLNLGDVVLVVLGHKTASVMFNNGVVIRREYLDGIYPNGIPLAPPVAITIPIECKTNRRRPYWGERQPRQIGSFKRVINLLNPNRTYDVKVTGSELVAKGVGSIICDDYDYEYSMCVDGESLYTWLLERLNPAESYELTLVERVAPETPVHRK